MFSLTKHINIQIELSDDEVLEYMKNHSDIIWGFNGPQKITEILDNQRMQLAGSSTLDYIILSAVIRGKMSQDLKNILFNVDSFKRDQKIDKILK